MDPVAGRCRMKQDAGLCMRPIGGYSACVAVDRRIAIPREDGVDSPRVQQSMQAVRKRQRVVLFRRSGGQHCAIVRAAMCRIQHHEKTQFRWIQLRCGRNGRSQRWGGWGGWQRNGWRLWHGWLCCLLLRARRQRKTQQERYSGKWNCQARNAVGLSRYCESTESQPSRRPPHPANPMHRW